MTEIRAYISGMGVVSSLGTGVSETSATLQKNVSGIRPLRLFPTAGGPPLPVGEVLGQIQAGIPRTHHLAGLAAEQAMEACDEIPDAVVLGVTTGGMPTTETLLKENNQNPELYRFHAIGSVAEEIARRYRCTGPVITVSTACSSGAVAIKIALEMLRSGLAGRVLAGGADALCRLTYYGFNSLQLIDPAGARPLDQNRRGMSVAEGAAMLLLTSERLNNAAVEILGAGLSCDAYHPTSPHPRGKGALAAMEAAIKDAGIFPADIDYINLHGTGTPDNDLSEARAIQSLFPSEKPRLSSVKGAFGHTLAAAGAIEAVVAAMSISQGWVPANTGCRLPDPELKLKPVMIPSDVPVDCVLSNSFGFGGNNAAIILGRAGKFKAFAGPAQTGPLAILGYACMTGAGNTAATMETVLTGSTCRGMLPVEKISENLSPRAVRRLKRLPKMALSLAVAAHERSKRDEVPSSVFMGTGWGALSETHDFLTRLFETGEQFPSPTDFVGSVHNAPASQIALQFQSAGANVTTSGGDYSFEQSLMTAHLLNRENFDSFWVVGADESHAVLSKLFDGSVSNAGILADGGGAFCLKNKPGALGPAIELLFYENAEHNPEIISSLVRRLGGSEQINAVYGGILAGIPGGFRRESEKQLKAFLRKSDFEKPVIDYRKITGEFASASAVAAVLAAEFLQNGEIPGPLCGNSPGQLTHKGVLVVGLGKCVTALAVFKQ